MQWGKSAASAVSSAVRPSWLSSLSMHVMTRSLMVWVFAPLQHVPAPAVPPTLYGQAADPYGMAAAYYQPSVSARCISVAVFCTSDA
jgi:hypothetical protein